MVNIFFIIIIFNININIIINDMIYFKLESSENSINKNSNISQIFNALEKSYIYSYIKIGDPEFSIETKFSLLTPHFFMLYNSEKNNVNKNYDINKSKTFKNISCLNQYYVQTNYDIHASEKFKFNIYDINQEKNYEKILNNFDFVLGAKYHKEENCTEKYYLKIGLQFYTPDKYTQMNKFNFINNLKNIDIIKNNNWFFYSEKKAKSNSNLINLINILNVEQYILIGGYPHEYKPDEFNLEQLSFAYTNNFLWSLRFKETFFYVNQTKFNSGIVKQSLYNPNSQINLDDIFIYTSYTYITMMKNAFFNYYLDRNICHIFYTDENDFFYCDKSDNFNINNLKEFPTLFFEHYEFNFTFEFTYQDLFTEINDKYIFLIGGMSNDVDDWFLGRIFFYKYQMFFNTDSKSIGFYNPNIKFNKKNKEKNIIIENEENKTYLIYVIILGCLLVIAIVFILVFVYIYKNYQNKKRKRANELDDEFDYVSDKNIN